MAKWERPDIRAMPYCGGLYVGVLKNFLRKFQWPFSCEKSLEVSNSRLTFVPDFSSTSTAKIYELKLRNWNCGLIVCLLAYIRGSERRIVHSH